MNLVHRFNKFDRFLAKLLLLTSLNTHFFIEHNRGHHKKVGTLEDPATARKNESIYKFVFRSMIFGYISAWNLEFERLKNDNLSTVFTLYSFQNQMVRFTTLQLAFVFIIYFVFGLNIMLVFFIISFIGIALLEIINYVEHYGLLRKKEADGRYEKINKMHSWNSNNTLMRLMSFELTRHSDHHLKASKKYQILNHKDDSPELPLGYPSMMVLSFFPPLFFYIMNPLIEKYQNR